MQEQIATDFGIATSTLKRWTAQADIDDGVAQGVTSDEQAELVALRAGQAALPPLGRPPSTFDRRAT